MYAPVNQKSPALGRNASCATSRLPAQSMPGSRHLWPAHGIERVRQTPHGVQPLAWGGAAPHHLSQLDKIQRRALALIGPGVFVDSLALRRTISGICFIYKLMCGPRVPCLQTLLPPRSTLDPLQGPDSKSGSQMATAFSFLQLYRPGPKTQSADHSLTSTSQSGIPSPQVFCESRA